MLTNLVAGFRWHNKFCILIKTMWKDVPVNPNLSLAAFNFTSDVPLTTRQIYPLPTNCFAMLLCGKPGSGKTNLLLNLLARKGEYYNGVFDRVFVISPSQKTFAKDWFESIPDEQRYDHFDEGVINDVVSACTDTQEKCLVLLDDCQNDLKANIRPLLRLLHNRRHIPGGGGGSISVLITAQVMNKVCLIGFGLSLQL